MVRHHVKRVNVNGVIHILLALFVPKNRRQ
jgi:hypothetical protein